MHSGESLVGFPREILSSENDSNSRAVKPTSCSSVSLWLLNFCEAASSVFSYFVKFTFDNLMQQENWHCDSHNWTYDWSSFLLQVKAFLSLSKALRKTMCSCHVTALIEIWIRTSSGKWKKMRREGWRQNWSSDIMMGP